jgi:hypothetical protein
MLVAAAVDLSLALVALVALEEEELEDDHQLLVLLAQQIRVAAVVVLAQHLTMVVQAVQV